MTDMPYRGPLDSNLERELLAYTLDTGSPLVRELKPLLFPIADNVLKARHDVAKLVADVHELRKRVETLEGADVDSDRGHVAALAEENKQLRDEAKRWKWWALGLIGSIASALAGSGATLLAK